MKVLDTFGWMLGECLLPMNVSVAFQQEVFWRIIFRPVLLQSFFQFGLNSTLQQHLEPSKGIFDGHVWIKG